MTSVSVVIVTYNSETVVPDCLRSLPDALVGVGSHEVVVVDNASTDGTRAAVAAIDPHAPIVALRSNLGYAAGINAGIAASTLDGDVLVLNPDIRLHPGSVRSLVDALKEPGTGIAVPKILGPENSLAPSLRREPSVIRALGQAVLGGDRAGRIPLLGEVISDPRRYARAGTAAWAIGAAMLISRRCLEIAGPWDESFFLYSEETEFCLRAAAAGFSVRYEPGAVATHLGGESTVRPELWSLLTANRVRLYRRHHGPWRSRSFWAATVLNEALRVRKSATHRVALRALIAKQVRSGKGPNEAEAGARPEDPGYICFSAQDWWYHNRAHSDFQLMRRVATQRTVLLVNSITMRMPIPGRTTMVAHRIRRKLASMCMLLRHPLPDVPDFHVFSPIIVPLYGFPWARAANAHLVRFQVSLAARMVGIRTPPVVVVTIPTAAEVVRTMSRRRLVLNRSDKHSAFGEVDQDYIGALETSLLTEADAVLYVSSELMAEESDLVGERAYFLDHGVDLDHFVPRPPEEEPPDLVAIPHPRLGFFGGLDDYVIDFDLLEELARALPAAHVVLIGDATCSMARFQGLDNVHWLGFRPYEQIPRYGSGFDVALMPWLTNDWIRHSNPIKLKEYLALGLPVVSTYFPELDRYEPWVDIAKDHLDFVVAVERCLQAGPDPEARAGRRAAAGADWDSKARELIAVCESPPTVKPVPQHPPA